MGWRDLGGVTKNCGWCPSYKVMNHHRWSGVLHQNWLLLIASEVGVPLCMGNCHTWNRCTSPTPCKDGLLRRWWKRRDHKRNMPRWSPNDLPVKLPWGGKMGSCGLDCGHLLEHLLRMGEDTGKVIGCRPLEENTYVRQRDDIYTHWCWQIVNWRRNAITHWTGSWQARPTKWNGGSEMGK